MRGAAKGARAFERRISADGNAVRNPVVGGDGDARRSLVVGKRALHHRIQIRIAAAQKNVAPNAALNRSLDAQSAIGLGIQALLIRAVRLQGLLKLILLSRRQVREQFRNQIQPDVLNLAAEFVVEEAGAEDQPLAKEGLLHAAFISPRGRRLPAG